MEFVYEEERRECKKISVGEVDSEKYIREVMVGIIHLSFMKKKLLYVNEKKEKCGKKITNEKEKDENER